MARRTKEGSLETRERLLDAALDVFHARGASTPSLSDIAQLAGVTRGAVYVHFENKADLFTALCERTMLPMDATSAGDPSVGPLARLRALCIYQMQQTVRDERYRRMSDILFHRFERSEQNAAIVERMAQRRGRCIDARKGLMREAMAAGELPADLDLDRAIPLLHACVTGIIRDSLLAGSEIDLERDATSYVDALLAMIQTSPSLKRPARAPAEPVG